ncbi:MAG TPA: hypothetical protein VEU47_20285, partial [Candidatus Cybelea sp.]|nr:hypothetical protein [Candidatus Cybelea sp.]
MSPEQVNALRAFLANPGAVASAPQTGATEPTRSDNVLRNVPWTPLCDNGYPDISKEYSEALGFVAANSLLFIGTGGLGIVAEGVEGLALAGRMLLAGEARAALTQLTLSAGAGAAGAAG